MHLLKLDVKDKKELQHYFIKYFKYGGIFVPSDEYFELGADVFLEINFVWQNEQLSLSGCIAWIANDKVTNYDSGIGVHFNNDKAGNDACHKIETLLGDLLYENKFTATL